ncbi:MAG: hypothetical protein EOM64_10500, partial [Erysipelotrichia bacterium]|nr:hypothetical protein [Erysipelotrichia bacterium]
MSSGYNRHQLKINVKDKKKALAVLAVLAVAISAGFFIMKKWEDDAYQTSGGESSVYVEPIITQPKSKEYNGAKYIQKKKIETYVLMGVDDSGTASAAAGLNDANRNDLNLVIVINNEDSTWRMLQLNRDAMVLMPTLGSDGAMYGSATAQLCLAHTYGNGLEMSCKNVVDTISNLLW